MLITSRANPTVKKLVSLADKKYRREYGEYIVEGIKSVDECIAAGCKITAVYCTEQYAEKYNGAVLLSDGIF